MSLLGIYRPMPGKGGSTIVVNPELEGNEPQLTGLEVDGEKYKTPHLYWHSIQLGVSEVGCFFIILSTSASAFTINDMKAILNTDAKLLIVAGQVIYSSKGYVPAYLEKDPTNENSYHVRFYSENSLSLELKIKNYADTTLTDTINQIF